MALLFIVLAFLIALFGTVAVRSYAFKKNILDIPNFRSSHTTPTPRGGGGAIVLSFLVLMLALPVFKIASWDSVLPLVGAGFGAALIGFLDDHSHVAARWRLLGHFLCALIALLWVKGIPTIVLFDSGIELFWFGYILAALFLVWMLNLYNFMDGIDGIAAAQAITVSLGGAGLFYLSGYPGHALIALLLASSCAGFLVWNFPPARIFMGDVGSGFLGVIIAIIALQSAWLDINYFWAYLILSAVFIVDATVTLFRRVAQGENVSKAHRSHAYQYAARKFGGHLPVTIGVLCINCFWLCPWALGVGLGKIDWLIGLLLSYSPLVILAFWLKAGKPETP